MIFILLLFVGIIFWTYTRPDLIFSAAGLSAAVALSIVIAQLFSSKPLPFMVWSFAPLFTAIGILIWSFCRPDFIFSYATMMAGAALYFVVPGLINAEQYELFPPLTLAAASLYVTACLVLATLGWTHQFASVRLLFSARKPFPATAPLMRYCLGALVFSAFFAWKLRGVDVELLAQSQWSGPQTIFHALTRPGYFVTAVAAIAYCVTRKKSFAVLALIAFGAYMLPPILTGKRDEIVEAGIIAALCWGLVLRKKLPKALVVAGGLVCAVLFSAIGTYRTVAKESGALAGVSKALSSETREIKSELPPEQRHVEANNYIAVVECYLEGRWPNFGMSYWNALVHRFVPGQILGESLKKGIQIRFNAVSRGEIMAKGMPSTTGSTFTGFSDTLQAFLFLGPLVFYFTGRLLRSVFLQAAKGSGPALFAYPHLLVTSGVAVTHSSNYMVWACINLAMWVLVWVIPMQKITRRGLAVQAPAKRPTPTSPQTP